MPQGRKKIPFSGKAKKEQLKAKKVDKIYCGPRTKSILNELVEDEYSQSVQKLNYQPSKRANRNANRFNLQFFRETDAEIKERKQLAHSSLVPASENDLEINIGMYFSVNLDFPKRPPWSFDMSPQQLEQQENKYFREYTNKLESEFGGQDVSYFELNLETWRQLWRVIEMSDILLIIVDIRFPALMFPPTLYEYVTSTLKKDMILILNKIDLAPASVVVAWKNYFKEQYPELLVLMFTSFPGYSLLGKQSDKAGLKVRRRKGKPRMAAEGTQLLFDACKAIVKDQVDLTTWQQKIKEEKSLEFNQDDNLEIGETIDLKKVDTSFFEHEKYNNGVLTIGCLGQPNVGKSSLMNAIMGKKVVSVSKTPGHTKHFQTIFLTPNVRLCDCPGLVFPSKVPKTLQVLMGSFPIAQLREPFTAIKYLAERLNLPKLLRIDHPEGDEEWSAMDICDGWAKKRGFVTAKAARLDSYRAANCLLRMALDGKICLCLRPPGFSSKKAFWEKHPDIESVKWILARTSDEAGEAVFQEREIVSDYSEEEDIGDHVRTELGSRSDEDSEPSEDVPVTVGVNKFSALNIDD